MHIANSGEMALEQLNGGIEPTLIVILSDINMPGWMGCSSWRRSSSGSLICRDDGDRVWR